MLLRRYLLLASLASVIPARAYALDRSSTLTHEQQRAVYLQCADNARSLIRFSTDQEVYGVPEYWATPAETLAKGAGDCEDYAFLLNHFCEQQGVFNTQIAVCYVNSTREVHVASVFNRGELLADTLLMDVRPAYQRTDLTIKQIGNMRAEFIPDFKRPTPVKP